MTQHRRSRSHEAGARRWWSGNRAWVAAAVGVLALLTAALVHLFARPVDPFEPPVLLPPAASAATGTAPPGGASPPGEAGTNTPENPPPSPSSAPPSQPPASPSGAPSPTPPGNGGLEPDGSTGDGAVVLARGDQGREVLDLQRRLREAGVDTAPVDGVFGQPTEAAVQNYQALRGIRTDPPGVYGPDTRSALERET
ncbi:peptidoglycan-binding domain-containing protein [Streptomyces sp. NPDC006624]|uniref:peptidoglycan-binding domain-containing protein n=1 Tax=unclassified Streptomyces TaxID=2593676 RepID=UPI0033B2A1D1